MLVQYIRAMQLQLKSNGKVMKFLGKLWHSRFRTCERVDVSGMKSSSTLLAPSGKVFIVQAARACLIFYLLVGALANTADAGDSITRDSKAAKPGGNILGVYIPLYSEDAQLVVVQNVPVICYERFYWELARSLSSPVYAASEKVEDRRRDINIISMSGVSVEFRTIDDDVLEYELAIDVTKAKVPVFLECEVLDVVKYVLTCVRMSLPPTRSRSVKVKIVGGQSDPRLVRLEGELWSAESGVGPKKHWIHADD